MKEKVIYLLVGPKGSGKSFIGTFLERTFKFRFVRVEDRVVEIKENRQIDDETYISDAFEAIETEVRNALKQSSIIVFESTGLTSSFDEMVERLKDEFAVIMIGIQAIDKLCLHRVKTRDQSIHVDVSAEQVRHLNRQVRIKNIKTDFSLDNNDKTLKDLTAEIHQIVLQVQNRHLL